MGKRTEFVFEKKKTIAQWTMVLEYINIDLNDVRSADI